MQLVGYAHTRRAPAARLFRALCVVWLGMAGAANAASLSGRVVDRAGAALAGVPLSARSALSSPGGGPAGWVGVAHEAVTGPDGAYVFADLADGRYEVRPVDARLAASAAYEIVAVGAGSASVEVAGRVFLRLRGDTTDVDLTVDAITVLPTGESTQLEVTLEDGSSAVDAAVAYTLLGPHGSTSMKRRTDANGRCTIRAPAGDGTLSVTHGMAAAILRLRFEDRARTPGPISMRLADALDLPLAGSEWRSNPDNGHEYRLIAAPSWEAAQKLAMLDGAHLATIGSSTERRWVATMLGRNVTAWVGLSYSDEEGAWRWVTGEKSKLGPWREGEPTDGATGERYAAMSGGNHGWRANDGSMPATGGLAIIERDGKADSTKRRPLDETGSRTLGDVVRELVPLAVGSVWTYRDAVSGEIASVRVTGKFDEADTEAVEGDYEPSAAGESTDNPAGQT